MTEDNRVTLVLCLKLLGSFIMDMYTDFHRYEIFHCSDIYLQRQEMARLSVSTLPKRRRQRQLSPVVRTQALGQLSWI